MANESIQNVDSTSLQNISGSLLVSHTPISFWGGVHPASGDVIDEHHPLRGCNISGRILAIPGSRGSCSGSSVLLELIDCGQAPLALIFTEKEEILVLGAMVASVMFGKTIALLQLDTAQFELLKSEQSARIEGNSIWLSDGNQEYSIPAKRILIEQEITNLTDFTLTDEDENILRGEFGKAAQVAMNIVLQMAKLQGATELIDIKQAHIDGCVFNGMSNLKFAEQLVNWGAKVKVPTTLNALSVDQNQWRTQGIDPVFGEAASAVGDAYVAMGAVNSFTCAPYLLDTAPTAGEQIVWAESNAVAYANSVLGAKTQKYPDFLDICIALTGRAPHTGTHLDSSRVPALIINAPSPSQRDDSFWPLLGYHVGLLSGNSIPMIRGLGESQPRNDDLKAFSAAFATTSSVPMFHIEGITPESISTWDHMDSESATHLPQVDISINDLGKSWNSLNTAENDRVDMICLGNPHFSYTEVKALATLCSGRQKHENIEVVVTLGRTIYQRCKAEGLVGPLQTFGVKFVQDTCWCMLEEPVIPPTGSVLMTNSGKYAHYGPGLVKRPVHFGSLSDCITAAVNGYRHIQLPSWLEA